MAKKKNTNETALVQVYERQYKRGVRFYLHYSIGGEQIREALTDIPLVMKSDKYNYKDTRAKVEAIAAERLKEIRNEQLGYNNRKCALLLSDWFATCVEKSKSREREGMNRHTWARTIEYTGEIVKQFAGENICLSDVDKDFCIGFIDYLKHGYRINRGQQGAGQHLKASSADKKAQALNFVLKEAVKAGLIGSNPFEQIDRADKIKVPESKRAFLTIDELKHLETTPTNSEGTRRAYLFMCYCGLRISDVKGLRWADIDTSGEPWTIAIRQQKTQTPLYLPLSEKAREYLPMQGDATATDNVFADLPTEPAMNRTLKKWAQRAGIEKTITLHTARHTYATTLLTKGADLYTVSKLLGHSEVATTQIYAKIVDSKKIDAVNLLNNL